MRANWIKIVFFVLFVLMLSGVAQVLLDPGLGKPEESRRTKHPAGFSAIPPHGWGGSVFYGADSTAGTLRISPEKFVGRQPSYSISRSTTRAAGAESAVPYTFQGKPAFLFAGQLKHSWLWRTDFERDGAWFRIALEYPVKTDVEGGPLWPFIQTFRVERPTHDAVVLPATAPATEPASR